MIETGNMSASSRISEASPVDRADDRDHVGSFGAAPGGAARPVAIGVKEFIMRYYPAAIALSLLVAVSGSSGQAKGSEPVDPRVSALVSGGQDLLGKGDVPGATDAFEAALAIDPGSVPAIVALADAAT